MQGDVDDDVLRRRTERGMASRFQASTCSLSLALLLSSSISSIATQTLSPSKPFWFLLIFFPSISRYKRLPTAKPDPALELPDGSGRLAWMAQLPADSSFIGDRDVCINGTPFYSFCSEIAAKSGHKLDSHARPKLLVSFTNFGYFDMAHNFIAALERLSIRNVIMFALDVPSFEKLKRLGIATWLLASREATVYTESSSSFGTPEFNSICNVKPWIVLECLRGGFDVVWTDTDVIWLRDAQPFFDINPNVDLQLQGDDDDICAGFFFARSNSANIKLLEKVLTYVNTCMDDQTALRRFLHESEGFAHRLTRKPEDLSMTHHLPWNTALQVELQPDVANYLVLPRSSFPNGTAYYNVKLPQRFGVVPYIVHNNCIIGHDSKVDRFKMYDQWFIAATEDVDFAEAPQVLKRSQPVLALRPHREVLTCLSMHPNKSVLYTAAYDKTVKAYKMSQIRDAVDKSDGHNTIVPTGGGLLNRRGGVWCMAWSNGVVSAPSSPTVTTTVPTNAALLSLLSQLDPSPNSNFASQLNDGASHATPMCYTGGHDRHVFVWKTDGGFDEQIFANQGPWSLQHTMKGHQGIINDLIFHREQVFTASDDCTVRSWDPTKGEKTRIFRAGCGWMSSLAADGPALFAASSDGCAYAWEISTGRLMQVYTGHSGWVRSIVVAGHRKQVYTAGSDGTIREWDMVSGDPTRVLRNAHTAGINKLLLTRSRRCDIQEDILYSCSDDGLIRAWKISDLECMAEYHGHSGSVNCILDTEDGLLVSGGADHAVLVWQAV